MECRGITVFFRYWVEFDDEGGIRDLHIDKHEGCAEYIVKLIPIDRTQEFQEELEKSIFESKYKFKKFNTELEKISKDLRRIKI